MHFVKKKKDGFLLELVVSEYIKKSEGILIWIEKVVDDLLRKNTELCAWSELAKIKLNLIQKMNFKGKVVQNLNLAFSLRRQSFLKILSFFPMRLCGGLCL